MQDKCKVYMDSYMASNGSCFMVTWTIFENHLLKVGLTKLGDYGTPDAHHRWFILFYHVWGLAWIENHWTSIWLRAQSHMTSHYTWRSVTTLYEFGGVVGQRSNIFFGLSHFHGYGSWLMCEVALSVTTKQLQLVWDDPKQSDGGGEKPKSGGRSWRSYSWLWNILFTKHKT